jgi:hypothetical protein
MSINRNLLLDVCGYPSGGSASSRPSDDSKAAAALRPHSGADPSDCSVECVCVPTPSFGPSVFSSRHLAAARAADGVDLIPRSASVFRVLLPVSLPAGNGRDDDEEAGGSGYILVERAVAFEHGELLGMQGIAKTLELVLKTASLRYV